MPQINKDQWWEIYRITMGMQPLFVFNEQELPSKVCEVGIKKVEIEKIESKELRKFKTMKQEKEHM